MSLEDAMSRATSELNVFQHETKIFRAGAGAGKTRRLVQEVYDFYKFHKKKNKKNPKVVLTTFTRKATQELRERLMLEAQKKNDYEFLNFVLSKNQLMISTIHGVLQLFLRQYAQLIGLDPGFKLTDDSELSKRARIIIKSLIANDVSYLELLEEFSFADLTKLIIQHHSTKAVFPNVTCFDKKDFEHEQNRIFSEVASELRHYADRISSETENEKWLEYCKHLTSVSESFQEVKTLADIQRSFELFASFRKPIFQKKKPPFSESLNDSFEEARKSLQSIKPDQFDPALWEKMIAMYKLFESLSHSFSEEFDKWKLSSGQISMADLELYSYRLVRDYAPQIHFFSENFDYWLIDEFQDTSPLQKTLLLAFIKDRKYFIVGDPQQSIYFFRGARVKVFDEMQERVVKDGGLFELLNTNYRSSKPVMAFVNYFFKNYSSSFSSMELGGPDGSQSLVAEIALAQDKDSQKNAILDRIIKLQTAGVNLGEICILGRKNDQLKSIADALHAMKIPHILHSASGFKERREILDALAILKFLVNPHDNFNFIQVIRSPWFNISDEEIYHVVKSRPKSFWLEFLKKSDSKVASELKKYIKQTYSDGITNTFQSVLIETGFLDLSLIYDPSGRRESNIWKLLVQLKTDDHLPDFSYLDFIRDRKSAIDLESGAEDSDAVSSIEPNRVQLMTIHMSKGLEFNHVIIPFIDSNPQLTNYLTYAFDSSLEKFGLHLKLGEEKGSSGLPAQKVVQDIKAEELNESDRLLYVAMTRAKSSILMSTSGAKQRSHSWFEKMKLNLAEGHHSHTGFEYIVNSGPWDVKTIKQEGARINEISKPLYDIGSLRKLESSRVTTELLEKKNHKVAVRLIEKANYGKLAHQIFESMKYNRQIESDEKTQEAVDYLKTLTEIPMESILRDGFAEWGFVSQQDGKNLSGQVDLWAVVNDELWVVDYKTGSPLYSDVAFEQLVRYSKAIMGHLKGANIKKTHLVALYPFAKKVLVKSS